MKRAGIIFFICLLVAGCTTPECFDNAPVDKSGSFYLKCEPAKLAGAWKERCDDFIKASADVTGRDTGETIKNFLFIKLLMSYSGVYELNALKMSSKPDEKSNTYTNRIAIEHTAGKSTAIGVFGKNCDLAGKTAGLPAGCTAAIAGSVDLNRVWNAFKSSELEQKKIVTGIIKMIFGTTPEKFAERHSGVWLYSRYSSAGEKEVTAIEIPDSGRHFYNHFQKVFGKAKDVSVAHHNGRTVFFTSPKGVEHYFTPVNKVADVQDFKRLIPEFTADSVLFFWAAKGHVPRNIFSSLPFKIKQLKESEFFTLQRTSYGFYGIGRSRNDWSVELLRDRVIDMLDIIPDLNYIFNREKNTGTKQEQVKTHSQECFENLQKLAECLKKFSANNNGKHPEGLFLDGINKLMNTAGFEAKLLCCPGAGCVAANGNEPLLEQNCGYLYFGNWQQESSGNLPLLIDMPENHNGYFYAVLRNGKVKLFRLKQQMSVKRMASYLHTVFKYSEDEFSELIKRAEELDKILDKESK